MGRDHKTGKPGKFGNPDGKTGKRPGRRSGKRNGKMQRKRLEGKLGKSGNVLAGLMGRIIGKLPEGILEHPLFTGNSPAMADKLNPGGSKEAYVRACTVKKLSILLMGVSISLILLAAGLILAKPKDLEGGVLAREDVKGSSYDITLEAEVASEGREEVLVTVAPRQYREEEISELYERVRAYLTEVMPGESESLDRIDHDLVLPDHMEGENVTIEWRMEDYHLLNADGSLGEVTLEELPCETSVTALVRYCDREEVMTFPVILTGLKGKAAPSLDERLLAAIEGSSSQNPTDGQLKLPDTIDGHTITWHYIRNRSLVYLGSMVFLIVICLFFYEDEKRKKQVEERRHELIAVYPGFVFRLVLLTGAGMNIRDSLIYILEDLEKNDLHPYLCKELKYACLRMKAGIPEIEVYQDMGRRMETDEYRHLSHLMINYVRMGSKGMSEMLLQEMEDAQLRGRDYARKQGETAGTKLLFPMTILLVLVLLTVIFPAFFTM